MRADQKRQLTRCPYPALPSCRSATGLWRAFDLVIPCNYALGGYYYDASVQQALMCPSGTYVPNLPARPIANGGADLETCKLW